MRRRAFNPYGLPVILNAGTGNSLEGVISDGSEDSIDYSKYPSYDFLDSEGNIYTFHLYDGSYYYFDSEEGAWSAVDDMSGFEPIQQP